MWGLIAGKAPNGASAEHKLLEQSAPAGEGREDNGKLSLQLQLPRAATSVTGNKSFWRHDFNG